MAIILRDKAIEVVIFGVLGGASGAGIALLWAAGFKAEHVFALVGAFIGATATVGGAIWVTDRNANADRAREVAILSRDLSSLVADSTKVREFDPDEAAKWSHDFLEAVVEFRSKLRGSRMMTSQAVENSRGLDFRQRAACLGMNEVILDIEKFYDEMTNENRDLTSADAINLREQVSDVIARANDTLRFISQ